MPSPFYITTAIDYANGSPHLGHAYEKVLSDVISRHTRMSGRSVHDAVSVIAAALASGWPGSPEAAMAL